MITEPIDLAQGILNDMSDTLKKVLIGLVLVLIACCLVLTAAIFSLSSNLSSALSVFQPLQNEKNEIVLSDEKTLTSFYQTLVGEIEKYGDLEKTEDTTASLMTQIFVKTMKDCTVKSVSYDKDRIRIDVQGVAVPMEKLDGALLTDAGATALKDYILSNPLHAISSAFGGETAIKEMLYGDMANEFLVTLKEKIMKMDVVPVHYTLLVRIEDGKWIIESMSEQPVDENQSDQTSISKQDQNASSDQAQSDQ